MLTSVRNNLNSLFVKILLGILVMAFAIWGVGPTMFAGNTNIVATVGEEEIDAQTFYDAVQERAISYQNSLGLKMPTAEIIQRFNVDQNVLGELMMDAAFRANASKMGISLSKDVIAQELAEIESFQVGGKYSRTAVEQYLQSSRTTIRELEGLIEMQVLRNQLAETLFSFEPKSTRLAEMIYAYDNERRDATMITITTSDIDDKPVITDEAVAAEYEKTKDRHQTPERRSYDYVMLTPQAFMDKVEASDEEIQTLYDSKASEYIIAETRTVNQVTFASESLASAFITKVKGGADFVTTAAAETDFTAQEIAIGTFSEATLASNFSEEAGKAVFAVEDKGVTAPVKSIAGYDVFQVSAITAGKTTTLDSVKAALITDIKLNKAKREMYRVSAELDADINAGTSFDILIDKFKLNKASVNGIDGRGQYADGKSAIISQEGAVVARRAFDLDTDEEPMLFDIDENDSEKGVFLVDVKTVEPPRAKTLDEVKDELKADLYEDAMMTKVAEYAEKALERLSTGEDPQAIINDYGGTTYVARRIGRVVTNTDENSANAMSQNIRNLLFSLDKGESEIERTADNVGYIVVRNDAIRPADLAAQKTRLNAFKAELAKKMEDDISSMYSAHLFSLFERTQNSVLIQSLLDQQQQR